MRLRRRQGRLIPCLWRFFQLQSGAIMMGMSALIASGAAWGHNWNSPLEMAAVYASSVDRQLVLPEAEALRYAALVAGSFGSAGLVGLPAQYVVLVDRSPLVQGVFIYWIAPDAEPQLVGASPASTGRGGAFEYFETPTGVFDHSIENPDFCAEGTLNSQGVRGYGAKGMRVFDFGWQVARKGWGDHSTGMMRLQMHATDPDILERRLGTVQSKGCIRIPATLNSLIDRYGLLDAGYEPGLREGKKFWVLHPDRRPTPWSGRYLVVVDSQRTERPGWARPIRVRIPSPAHKP